MNSNRFDFARRGARPTFLAPLALLVPLFASGPAAAQVGYATHVEGSAARMVGDEKSRQFGWGGAGIVAPELTFGEFVGIEAAAGGIGLSDGPEDDPTMAPTEA